VKVLVWAAQGVVAGVTSLVAAVLTAFAIAKEAEPAGADCVDVCLPDLGPAILAILAMPVVMGVVGPLVAKLLRLPTPGLFAAPVAWAVVVASVWLGPPDSRDHWPFNSLTSTVSIFLALYAVLAVWAGGQRQGWSPR
jgi:hypothetical protein